MVQEVLIEEIEVEEVVTVGIEITITIKANIFQMVDIEYNILDYILLFTRTFLKKRAQYIYFLVILIFDIVIFTIECHYII